MFASSPSYSPPHFTPEGESTHVPGVGPEEFGDVPDYGAIVAYPKAMYAAPTPVPAPCSAFVPFARTARRARDADKQSRRPIKKAVRKPSMARAPLRKAAPTAGGTLYKHPLHGWIEKPAQDGSLLDTDLPRVDLIDLTADDDAIGPIAVEWSPPTLPPPMYDYESCMTGYMGCFGTPFEC